jgi:hypothetical protein
MGDPRFDGDEIADAGFFSLEEMAAMDAVQGLSKWAIEKALRAGEGYGLQLEPATGFGARAGWQLFGLG